MVHRIAPAVLASILLCLALTATPAVSVARAQSVMAPPWSPSTGAAQRRRDQLTLRARYPSLAPAIAVTAVGGGIVIGAGLVGLLAWGDKHLSHWFANHPLGDPEPPPVPYEGLSREFKLGMATTMGIGAVVAGLGVTWLQLRLRERRQIKRAWQNGRPPSRLGLKSVFLTPHASAAMVGASLSGRF